jgi:pimeloyl-ACP methyl ester carboxylesterase
MVLWGREDAIIPPSAGRLYQQAIPGARMTVLEQCGHMPEMEQPHEFVQAVLDFFT